MASSKVTQVTLTRHRRRRVFYSGLTFFISLLTQLLGTNDQVMDKVVRTKQLDGSSSVNGEMINRILPIVTKLIKTKPKELRIRYYCIQLL